MNIYLDIDGVLLANDKQAALYADQFLRYILRRWPTSTYWLTTHHWRRVNTTRDVLAPALVPSTLELLHLIKPAAWDERKTDGIDFNQPFLWFDDDLYPEEKAILKHYDALDCFRQVLLERDPHQLMDELDYLRSLA